MQRSKIHKLFKDGQLSYEDEKFSYIAVSKLKHDKNVGILGLPKLQIELLT